VCLEVEVDWKKKRSEVWANNGQGRKEDATKLIIYSQAGR
jgi:hypothetical protein